MNGSSNKQGFLDDVPMPLFARLLLVTAGSFAIVVPTRWLWRGVWPLNATTPWFLLIITGAWVVGLLLILGGLFSPGVVWHIAPGGVCIDTGNPFWRRRYHYRADDITCLSVEEVELDGQQPTWRVAMATRDGRTHTTRRYESRGEADLLKDEIREIVHPLDQ
jgi:hypothetical protein